MAEVWKRVKLKDPITGEYLAPVTGQESDTIDADTLQGQTANEIVDQAVSQVTTMVSSKLDAVIQVTYNGGGEG